ncbi:MAG TPA: carbohydrate kinase family protein [Candidatus Acidoferrales bacterium]|nr:carbohydrate kinase family protein [Candidatus Acidoferrales bacterium]
MPALPETVDVVGVGINATDTIIRLPRFPEFNSKLEILSVEVQPGGQVASALVALQRWGLKTRYVGKVGEDEAGRMQMSTFAREGVAAEVIVAAGASSQMAFILVDEDSGERTILWKRDAEVALRPEELRPEWITQARLLHVDGHDTAAAATAARWARLAGIPVSADLDTVYPGVEALLPCVDYMITSRQFPERITGESDLRNSLPALMRKYHSRVTAATMGSEGVLAWDGAGFSYCPAFEVNVRDTTGAGDIFHGAFLYGVFQGWSIGRQLEFSSAAAALDCTASGARGKIAPLADIEALIRTGRRLEPAFPAGALKGSGE